MWYVILFRSQYIQFFKFNFELCIQLFVCLRIVSLDKNTALLHEPSTLRQLQLPSTITYEERVNFSHFTSGSRGRGVGECVSLVKWMIKFNKTHTLCLRQKLLPKCGATCFQKLHRNWLECSAGGIHFLIFFKTQTNLMQSNQLTENTFFKTILIQICQASMTATNCAPSPEGGSALHGSWQLHLAL